MSFHSSYICSCLVDIIIKSGSQESIASTSAVYVNKITRQGNYCLLNFVISNIAIDLESGVSIAIGSVPTNFLPLEVVTITCYGTSNVTDSLGLEITIQKNGEIALKNVSKEKEQLVDLRVSGAGYESKPLS